ncbi:MAG: glycosyltransferase, partial [Candidatus Saccharibacteria bacterium]
KEEYILYVGGNDYRKYVTELIGYFEKIKQKSNMKDLKLVLVGNDFQQSSKRFNLRFWEKHEKSPVKDAIIMMGYVENNTLAALYRDCSVLAFPSQYEGFGMPVLEAMQAGAPVVAFSNSSLPEVAGDAALLAKNEHEYIKFLESLITNKALARKLTIRGHAQAKKFTWKKTADLTVQAIREVFG